MKQRQLLTNGKKSKGRKQAILDQFELEEIHHRLDDCVCPDCKGKLKEIGTHLQRQELIFIPAQLKRVAHIQHAYKCQACSEGSASDKIIKAPVPKAPVPKAPVPKAPVPKAPVPKAPLAHSLGFTSIIAHTIHQKFNLKVPNYRQESDWAKLGFPISRKEMANWHIKSAQYYFKPLYSLLSDILKEQSVLHADETS